MNEQTADQPKNVSPAPRLIGTLCLGASLFLAACASDVSPNRYGAGAVGELRQAERGEIDSYRYVEIRTDRGVGTFAGAGIGAAAGSTVGHGGTGVVGAIGGALIGGVIGNAIDKEAGKNAGYEYVIKTEKGALLSLVQADKVPIPKGAPVLIVHGRGGARIILDESRIDYSDPAPTKTAPETPENTGAEPPAATNSQ